ncbi:hypothetical protein [Kistimonas asteriae]|uniref:hypothetical protein n=1 Tax=Kistimonas asteriae TaxID=517724 RepID=UPI001BA46824|nr:hypothetical protein [Kistimonas asteriae]
MKHISEITIGELNNAVKDSAENAISDSKEKGLPVTYKNDAGQLVKEYPDGRIEIIEDNDND